MNKHLIACSLLCFTPGVFAAWGSGLYLTIGGGGAQVDAKEATSFDLDYPNVYVDNLNPNIADQVVLDNLDNTVQYQVNSETVAGGRAAIGYLWNFFEGEPTKMLGAIYTVNATLGLEFGYRLFDKINSDHTEIELDTKTVPQPPDPQLPPGGPCTDFPPGQQPAHCFEVDETLSVETTNQAFDLLAVARLPFTEDNRFALLLKGGVAYNMNEIKETLTIEADLETPPSDYDKNLDFTAETNDEFLPVWAVGLEYMFYSHFGISVEYNAITGSSHDADSQLLYGSLVFRM